MTAKKTLLFPSYFPAIASFAAMVQHEVVWEVSGNYQKQSLRNRAYITNDRGKHTLTIPVQGKGELTPRRSYDQIPIDNSQPWQRNHWRTLQTAYRTSPFLSTMNKIQNRYLRGLMIIYQRITQRVLKRSANASKSHFQKTTPLFLKKSHKIQMITDTL